VKKFLKMAFMVALVGYVIYMRLLLHVYADEMREKDADCLAHKDHAVTVGEKIWDRLDVLWYHINKNVGRCHQSDKMILTVLNRRLQAQADSEAGKLLRKLEGK
jgi:hypothetical protein